MGKWQDLTAKLKALVIKFARLNGVSNISDIRDTYNLYSSGGDLAHKYDGKLVGLSQELQRIPEVSIIEEPWADAWFKDNKNVAGMAIGKGLNGVDGDRRVIINPYNTQMNDSTSRASVLLNERLRHVMDQENFSLPNITKELMQKYEGTSYLGDTLNIGRTEAARYLSGDPSHNLTNNLRLYIDSLKLNHKKSGEELGESQDLNYPNGVIRQGKLDIFKKIVQSPVGAFTRFIDPTGILSIPDAYYDLKHLVETPTTQRTTADYVDAGASIVGLFPLGNNISDLVKVKNWRQGLQLANKYAEHLPFKLVGVYPDMYLYHNQKSTGGPLYPFSFEKNPFLKTPVVRYDEGGEIANINLPEFTVMPRDSFVTYTGEETIAPTLGLFIKSKQDEARVLAGHKMLNIEKPVMPIIPSLSLWSKAMGYLGMSDLERINRYGICLDPETCIYTATSMYPKQNRVSGTETFADNSLNYGFIPVQNGVFGDIGLFDGHGTMITGFNNKSQPVLSYSRGGLDASHILIDNDNWENSQGDHYLGGMGPMTSYRFVGTPEQQREWANLYNTLYSR